MSAGPATRPKQPRGSGDLRTRLLRYHVPLGLASAIVLLLFMGIPLFDATRYPHADIFSSSFPQDRELEAPMQHGSQPLSGGHAPPAAQPGPGGHVPPPGAHGSEQPSSSGPAVAARDDRSTMRRLTVATGYLALALLALTLLIGPGNLLLRRRNPVSSYLRRDVGAWTAAFSVVHVIFSLKVHGSGRIRDFLDFFFADGSPLSNSFGLGNWTGLAGLMIVVLLLALSSDAALRKLKARNWKRLQRLNYALFALVIAHAFFYGALARETSPYTILGLATVVAVLVAQALGVWVFRSRSAQRAAERP